jgi:hypothetical protein
MAQPAGNFRVNPKTMNGDPTPGRKKTLMTVVGLGSYRSIVATPQGGRIDLGALKGVVGGNVQSGTAGEVGEGGNSAGCK